MPWARRGQRTIPSMGSRKLTVEINDYSLGFNSFVSNDKFPMNNGGSNMWRVAKNGRITTLGDYETRKGVDFHSVAVGETKDISQEATSGASTFNINTTTQLAQKFTPTQSGRLTKVDIKLANTTAATGVIRCELWTDSSNKPGSKIASSSIAETTPTGTAAYHSFYYNEAPSITAATSFWLVVYVQSVATNTYALSTTTAGTDSLSTTNGGASWTANTFALNFKQYYTTSTGVTGLYRAYKTDGTKVTLFVSGTTLYSVNNTNGALTTVKSGLSASATRYYFEMMNDVVYYVNGYDGYRKWDFTTESQVNATNYSGIAQFKGCMFLTEVNDPNRVAFSEFGVPETFTSTDWIEVPAPKTGDPVTALVPLNGYLFIRTLNNCFILSGDDRDSFSLSEAPDQHGTYNGKTIVADKNFMYYLSNDGVYRSNGSEAKLLSENIYQEIVDLQYKDNCTIQLNGGKLYLWYRAPGSAYNNECYVWNLNFSGQSDTVESRDTLSFVSRAFSAFKDDTTLLVGSSLVGQVFWQEKPDNDYTNIGGDIEFELSTNYMSFVSPAVLKEIRYWEPRFGAKTNEYYISCEYAYDLRENWTLYKDQDIQGSGATYGSGLTYGSGNLYGTTSELQSYLYVPGEYRRIALRYKHYATRQPHNFLGHTLVVEVRRIR